MNWWMKLKCIMSYLKKVDQTAGLFSLPHVTGNWNQNEIKTKSIKSDVPRNSIITCRDVWSVQQTETDNNGTRGEKQESFDLRMNREKWRQFDVEDENFNYSLSSTKDYIIPSLVVKVLRGNAIPIPKLIASIPGLHTIITVGGRAFHHTVVIAWQLWCDRRQKTTVTDRGWTPLKRSIMLYRQFDGGPTIRHGAPYIFKVPLSQKIQL